MPKVTLTRLAREDIKAIGRYTQNRWGVLQRNHYLGTLDETIRGMPDTRRFDRNGDHIKPGLLFCACQEHMIFFRRNEQGDVEVLRILGQSMDFRRHL